MLNAKIATPFGRTTNQMLSFLGWQPWGCKKSEVLVLGLYT